MTCVYQRIGMRPRIIPILLLVLLINGYLALVFSSGRLLPDRVATHFGASGQPDDWMSRSGYLNFTAWFGIGLPLFILAIILLSRFLPVSLVNVPHKQFWFAPERRELAQSILFDHSLYLASWMVLFFGAMHYLVIVANRSDPVRLPSHLFFPVLLVFVAGIIAWIIALYRRFPRPAA